MGKGLSAVCPASEFLELQASVFTNSLFEHGSNLVLMGYRKPDGLPARVSG